MHISILIQAPVFSLQKYFSKLTSIEILNGNKFIFQPVKTILLPEKKLGGILKYQIFQYRGVSDSKLHPEKYVFKFKPIYYSVIKCFQTRQQFICGQRISA